MVCITGLKRLVRAPFIAAGSASGISSKATDGRFHSDGDPTSYLATRAQTAVLEVKARIPRARLRAWRLLCVTARLHRILDFTDAAVRRKYRITKRQLVAKDQAACQRLAARLRTEGIEAILTFSRVDTRGRQLVVFLD